MTFSLTRACCLLLSATLAILATPETRAEDDSEYYDESITLADDAADESSGEQRKRPKRVLERIVVTAQKVEQSLEDVAASVTTLEGDFIRESGLFGFADLQNYSANTDIRLHPWGAQLRMRGFGTSSSNRGFEPSVASVVDGVYYGRSQFLNAFFHDIDRIEVLRGPQGTLFGKNSSAGVLNVETVKPGPEWGGHLDLVAGDFGEKSLRPALNIPLGENLAARVSGNFSENDGLLHNTFLNRPEYNQSQKTGKLRLRWTPDDRWTVDLTGFSSRQIMNNAIFQLSHVTTAMAELIRSYDPAAEFDGLNSQTSANYPTMVDVEILGGQSRIDYDFEQLGNLNFAEFTWIASNAEMSFKRRDIDADFSAVPFIRDSLLEPSPFRQHSQELRLAGDGFGLGGWGRDFNFVVGLFLFESTLKATDIFELQDLGAAGAYFSAANQGNAPPGSATGSTAAFQFFSELIAASEGRDGESESAEVRLDQFEQAAALFGQLEMFLTERFALITGLRLGVESKQGDFSSVASGEFITRISEVEPHDSFVKRNEKEVSPKLGLKFQPYEDFTIYGTWSRGFKSGGFNALPLNNRNLEFDPERASSFELGLKTRVLGGAMRISAAAFHTRFDSLQVNTFGNGNFVTLNSGAAVSRGFEMDLDILPPLQGMNLRASVGLADAFFTRYPNAPAPADSEQGSFNSFPANAFGFCNQPGTDQNDEACATQTQDLAGKPIAGSPKWSATIIPSFTFPLPWTGALATVAADWAYKSERFLDIDLDPRSLQVATQEINARVMIGDPEGQWGLIFAARNLTGEKILDEVLDQPLAPGNFAAIRQDKGRFLSAQLNWSF